MSEPYCTVQLHNDWTSMTCIDIDGVHFAPVGCDDGQGFDHDLLQAGGQERIWNAALRAAAALGAELVDLRPPVRLCCGQRHLGSECPDGSVMCCMCYDRVRRDQLNRLPDGQLEDCCRECAEAERKAGSE